MTKPYEILDAVQVASVAAARDRLTREFGAGKFVALSGASYQIWSAADGRRFTISQSFAGKRSAAIVARLCEIRLLGEAA